MIYLEVAMQEEKKIVVWIEAVLCIEIFVPQVFYASRRTSNPTVFCLTVSSRTSTSTKTRIRE